MKVIHLALAIKRILIFFSILEDQIDNTTIDIPLLSVISYCSRVVSVGVISEIKKVKLFYLL